MTKRLVLAAIAWICLAFAVSAQTLTFPTLSGRVVDQAGLLSAEDLAALTASLAELESKTTDQLVVVTLPSLQGTAIEDYGYQLGRRWGIGQKDKDSGALLIVAGAERKVRIEVGYGLEGVLTDAATRLVIETSILPALKAGDMPGGIRAGVGQLVQLLEGDAPAQAPKAAGAHAEADGAVWPGILLGLAAVGLLIFCAFRGGGACRGIMQLLFVMALSGRGGGSSRGGSSSFTGGGGSFGGGGSSGSW